MATSVLLADDHPVVRQGFRALLEQQGLRVVGEAADGQEAVEMVQRLHPEVVVLDIAMPRMNGIEAGREIARTCPETRVVVLTAATESPSVVQALRHGVRGFVTKTQAVDDLCRAILEVARGGIYVSPDASHGVLEAFRTGTEGSRPLTPRERQVLLFVAEGKATKEIAALVGISVKTVEFHRARLMAKLDIHDTAGLVRYAIRQGMITA
jgi:DNA-binding NarL/FixJ family response regulator